MNRQPITYYLQSEERLSEISINDIENWLLETPYSQPLRILLAKKKKNQSSHSLLNTVNTTAAYVSDRIWLYKELHTQSITDTEVKSTESIDTSIVNEETQLNIDLSQPKEDTKITTLKVDKVVENIELPSISKSNTPIIEADGKDFDQTRLIETSEVLTNEIDDSSAHNQSEELDTTENESIDDIQTPAESIPTVNEKKKKKKKKKKKAKKKDSKKKEKKKGKKEKKKSPEKVKKKDKKEKDNKSKKVKKGKANKEKKGKSKKLKLTPVYVPFKSDTDTVSNAVITDTTEMSEYTRWLLELSDERVQQSSLTNTHNSKTQTANNQTSTIDKIENLESKESTDRKAKKKKKKKAKKKSRVKQEAKRSLKAKDEVISELWADLLAKQGHIKDARKMYRKLSLKYPEKSSYFAAKSDNIKKK